MTKVSRRNRLVLPFSVLFLPLFAALRSLQADVSSPSPEPAVAVVVDHAILRLSSDPKTPTQTRLEAKPLHFPAHSSLTFTWQQLQDEMVPGAAPMATHRIQFSTTTESATIATFPDSGVYEIRATVTDSQHHQIAARNVWVRVWDYRPALKADGRPDPLTVIGGLTPPRHVRDLTPEPGPFQHPRLLCSNDDWKDVHARCVDGTSKIAAGAFKTVMENYGAGLNPKKPDGLFLAQVEAYADRGYSGPAPDLKRGQNPPDDFEKYLPGLANQMALCCLAQWIKLDPALPHQNVSAEDQALCRKLAQQVAGLCRLLLDNSWDRKTGQFKKDAYGYIRNLDAIGEGCPYYEGLAFAYDFIAPWMTPDQARDTRNLIIAMGMGRKGPGQDSGHADAGNRNVQRGFQQNGTFAVWGEPYVWMSLAVAGEESGADPAVVETFLNPPKPANYDQLKASSNYDVVRPVEFDGGGKLRISSPYPVAIIWPHARKADVNNLQKEIWTFQDGMITPWGFTLERLAYFGFISDSAWPTAYSFARYGGFNQFVGDDFYQSVNNWIYTQYASGGEVSSTSFKSNLGMYEHHTGGGDYRQQFILFLKWMYPDDPAVDYAYASQVPDIERRSHNLMTTCLFGLDPGIKEIPGALEPMARAKELPLTKLDPALGIVCFRNGWKDDDLMIYFNAGHALWGHMNAEHGSFGLFALGRHWSVPSGYHKVLGNFQTLIQVQNPDWAADPTTHGYMTENPCFKPDLPSCDYFSGFPTPSAKLLEVKDAPDQTWSLVTCDLTTSYNYTCGAEKGREASLVPFDVRTYMYPGYHDYLTSIDPLYGNLNSKVNFAPVPAGCTIEHAFRTLFFRRGAHPYVLVVDDFQKSDKPANYRWTLNDKVKMMDEGRGQPKDESFCVELAPGATATEATMLHQRDRGTQPGLPRMLVRDVSENDNSRQPPIHFEHIVFHLPEKKYSVEDSNSLFIPREQVIDPRYKVLFFPYKTGENLPTTTWNAQHTRLTVHFADGQSDILLFNASDPDHRTRVTLE